MWRIRLKRQFCYFFVIFCFKLICTTFKSSLHLRLCLFIKYFSFLAQNLEYWKKNMFFLMYSLFVDWPMTMSIVFLDMRTLWLRRSSNKARVVGEITIGTLGQWKMCYQGWLHQEQCIGVSVGWLCPITLWSASPGVHHLGNWINSVKNIVNTPFAQSIMYLVQ